MTTKNRKTAEKNDYQFYSQLTPEDFHARLREVTKPMERGWLVEKNQAFSQFLPDGRFCLAKTDGKGDALLLVPFIGTVKAEGAGSLICGSFRQIPGMQRFLLIAMVCAFLLGLAIMGDSIYAVICLAVCVIIWACVIWLMWTRAAPALCLRGRKETLEFLQENLLQDPSAKIPAQEVQAEEESV